MAIDPGYRALRTGADYASAIRGQTIAFTLNDAGSPPPPPAEAIASYTAPSADMRPQVLSGTVAVGSSSCPVDTTQCSALFWSESAIEKFLLPYYVSAGGPHALEVLHAINHAWYAYPDDYPVVAVAFGYPSQPAAGAITLWDTVSVYYTSGGAVTTSSLLSYIADKMPYPVPQPPLPAPTVLSLLSPTVEPSLVTNSIRARQVAEYVSGVRGNTVQVYGDPATGGLLPSLTRLDSSYPLLFAAVTPPVRPARPVATVSLDVALKGTVNLWNLGDNASNIPDSVFWTDAAVDLLLLPYYASVYSHLAPWYLILLLGEWAGLIPPEIGDPRELLRRVGKAGPTLLRRALRHGGKDGVAAAVEAALEPDGVELDGETQSTVYSIVHLPRSEWVDEQGPLPPPLVIEGFEVEHRTWMLTADEKGAHPLVAPPHRLIP